MTPLRQRMLHELQRRNYAPSTIRSYLGAVRQFAEHFHCSPEQLGREHLRGYQRYLLQEKKLEPSTVEIRISALRFLYKRTLKRRDLATTISSSPRCHTSCRPCSARMKSCD
jgi:integrase/recombinase XerD